MRVLLAIDGSAAADSARELVRSLPWPHGTVIEVVAAIEPAIDPLVAAGIPHKPAASSTGDRAHLLEGVLRDAVSAMETPGCSVRRLLLEGRPASVIVNEAVDSRAELAIIGSRGLGPLKSMLLGSVSAEVVDHAPCPVLVVRPGPVERILLAVDGSASALGAATYLAGSRFLAGLPVEVLTVATAPSPPLPVPVSSISDNASESYDATIRAYRDWAETTAARATRSLRDDGVHARWSISQGDPAHEIIKAARDLATGLVVLGSRGYTGLTRVLLGSVARNVLLHTDASVLIVREPLRARSREARRAQAGEVGGRLPLGQAVSRAV